MIIKATSHTIKNIWIFILLIFLIFITFLGTLIHGIAIDSISLPKVKIEQLYIKLDKKLIVTIEKLEIDSQTQNDSSLEESAFIIKNFPLINQLFETININQLNYHNESVKLLFSHNTFFIQSHHLDANLQLFPTGKHQFDVNLLHVNIKDYHLFFDGKASIDLEKEQYGLEANFDLFGIKGISIIEVKNNLLTYHLQSEHFTNNALSDVVNFLAPQVELDPIAKAWIHENIKAKEYQLHFVEGKFDLKTGDYFPLEIRGRALVKDANVSFEPSVPSAHVEEIGITFQEDKLFFDIKNAHYQEKPLEKADVHIYNLIAKGTGIVVDLNATSALDEQIHKILHAFHITVPIDQTKGVTPSHIRLDIKFLPYDINATGTFTILPSQFLLSGIPMSSNFGEILLDNRLVRLQKTNMRYKNLFDINATGTFDTTNERFEGLVDINSLALDFGQIHLIDIANLSDQEAFFTLENNATFIALPTLGTQMRFSEGNNSFHFKDISKIENFSPLMRELGLSSGVVDVTTKDFEHFEANLFLNELSTPFRENQEPLTTLKLHLKTDTKTLDAISDDGKLSLHYDTALSLHVKDLNLSIAQNDNTFDIPLDVTITGDNSSFHIQESNKTILSDHYTLKLKESRVQLNAKKDKTHFEFEQDKHYLRIHGTSMSEHFTNALLGNHYFDKGDFSLQIEGKNSKDQNGTFILQQTYIKDLKFFNNLMATINTIPSLLVFNDPNFSQQGYFVQNGYIEFEQKGEILYISEMQLRGSSADIVGSGEVNLMTNELNLKLQIRTLKTFSSAIDMIPLVGGLILGDDKKIATNISVTGNVSDPKIETHLIADTFMTPVNIIKRTLELPLEMFK
ncbi:MAG: AsmA-like C-terminal domain-containing protein [Sulfurospirillum sp.]|nr:AsmA-like C-terminal domain-containing protein [Sulfurospirillum sp.]